jgi:hypothetical protein
MKKYVKLLCSVCARQKDQLIDQVHYTPDRCTITLGCEGRLSVVGLTSRGSSILNLPPTDSFNWYPRGSTLTTPVSLQNDTLYDLSTGHNRQLVIAVPHRLLSFVPSPAAELKIDLEIEQQSSREFRQYVYTKNTPFTAVNGVESAQAKKVLRYTTEDEVQVYLNGVKRVEGVDYTLYDGTSASSAPPNTVLFLTQIAGSNNQVDVIVTRAPATQTITLLLDRIVNDQSLIQLGAWEGIETVASPSQGVLSPFSLNFDEVSSTVPLNAKMRLVEISIRPSSADPWGPVSEAFILLSRTSLYTAIDRLRSVWVPLTQVTDNNYLMTKLDNQVKKMFVTESAITNVFPALSVTRFGNHRLVTSLTGDSASSEIDNDIIIGPDA